MRQISLVGAVDEEVGDYFPEFLGMLAESPFLEVSVVLALHKYPTLSWVCVSAIWKGCPPVMPTVECWCTACVAIRHAFFINRGSALSRSQEPRAAQHPWGRWDLVADFGLCVWRSYLWQYCQPVEKAGHVTHRVALWTLQMNIQPLSIGNPPEHLHLTSCALPGLKMLQDATVVWI